MSTINQIIERVDAVKPNAYSEEQKAEWIHNLDGRISREILKENPPQKYMYPEDGDRELLAPYPHDSMYDYYVRAMIDFANKEYNSYNKSVILYNEAFEAYAKLYQREHMPKSKGGFKNLI